MVTDQLWIKKIPTLLLLALMIFGVISALGQIDKQALSKKFEESPKLATINFFLFSQAFGSITPVWKFQIGNGELHIPYPDGTDFFGLIIFAAIAWWIVRNTKVGENVLSTWVFYILFLLFGWVIWKVIMYLAYYWIGNWFGQTYEQLSLIRESAISRGIKMGKFLVVLIAVTCLGNIGKLARSED